MNPNTVSCIAIAGLFVLILCMAGVWICFSDPVQKPQKCAYARKLGRATSLLKLARLTASASADPSVKIYANDIDNFMIETNAAAAAASSYYPAMIITQYGANYQFKTSADAEVLSHNMMSGVTTLGWAKGIALTVWIAGSH